MTFGECHERILLGIDLIMYPLGRHVEELVSSLDGIYELLAYAVLGVVEVGYLGCWMFPAGLNWRLFWHSLLLAVVGGVDASSPADGG